MRLTVGHERWPVVPMQNYEFGASLVSSEVASCCIEFFSLPWTLSDNRDALRIGTSDKRHMFAFVHLSPSVDDLGDSMTHDKQPDSYATIAAWYDVEHDPLTEDIECYQALIADADLRTPEIIEVGCGTGRVLARLAAAGYSVTGVDPSEAMRQRCERRLATLPERVSRRVRLLAGDAEHLPLGDDERFDLAIFSLNTFAHLTTSQSRLTALRALAAHLRPGALLLIDLDLLGSRRLAETAGQLWWQGTWPLPENNAVLLSHFVTAAPISTPGALRVTHFYDIHEQGGEVRRAISTMSLALISKGELEVALQYAGFSVDEVFGDYELTAWDDVSSRAIFVARRAGQPAVTADQAG